MADSHATAEAIGGTRAIYDAWSSHKTHESLQRLFDDTENFAHDTSPPPAKKRRTSEHTAHTQDRIGADDVPIVEISVNIRLQDAIAETSAQETCKDRRRAPVDIQSCQCVHQPQTIELTVTQRHRRVPAVTLPIRVDSHDELLVHMQYASALPASRTPLSKTTSPPQPMWADTYITQQENGLYILLMRIYCTVSGALSSLTKKARAVYSEILTYYCNLPTTLPDKQTSVTLKSFYEVVHHPHASGTTSSAIQHPALETELYPFQKRTVSWLLEREGVQIQDDGSFSNVSSTDRPLPYSFHERSDVEGRPFCASALLCHVVRSPGGADSLHRHLHGGVLCEEMGLGKTVELIDLLCLHKRTAGLGKVVTDAYSNEQVTVSSATLIVTPTAILDQWLSEVKTHAPGLKVWHYTGVKRSDRNIHAILLEQDVVVTSYQVLAQEIYYADEKPGRNLRHQKRHIARRSPLVQILWWRVCLDEAQMIESGVSSAAIVARRIPRCNAWASTGTPLRKDIKDLLGLLIFLRFEPFSESAIWKAMYAHPGVFQQIFNSIALRHTKVMVRDELEIPPQRRVVVTLPFTAIEEQHYKELFDDMCADVGLDRSGAPAADDWDPDSEGVVHKMRQWLTRLRQTCLHPEVGERNKRALGRRNGPLRTVEEVLKVMVDQNETALRLEERAAIVAKMTQGHLYSVATGADKKEALRRYLHTFEAATEAVIECRDQLRDEAKALEKSVGTSKQRSPYSDSEDGDDASEKLSVQRNRLRNALELQHAAAFFVATAYYQVKMQTTNGDEQSQEYRDMENCEANYYETARNIRGEMLRDATRATKKLIGRAKATGNTKTLPFPTIRPKFDIGGIESQKVFRAVQDITDLLNDQSRQIQEWRERLVELLSARLLDQDDVELTGEEYDTTLKYQDEQYVYLFVLRALVADRHELLTGQVNQLVEHEVDVALKQAKEGKNHAPELMQSALNLREPLIPMRKVAPIQKDKIRGPQNEQSIRGLIADLRNMITALHANEGGRGGNRAAHEAKILEDEMQQLQQISTVHTKALAVFEDDVDLYRSTMNSRLEYYRQVQVISDTVKPYQEDESDTLDEAKLAHEVRVEERQLDKVRGLRTKRRFLIHLRSQKTGQEERRPCTICLQPFENGVLTVCAHEFCKDCISLWMSEHRTCPVCKKSLRASDVHDITYKPRDIQAQEERHVSSPTSSTDKSDSSAKDSIYSSIPETSLNEIKAIDLPHSWGSKIDAIARHILYLRAIDPGSKTVIFSQYRDFLRVLGNAMHKCKIGHSGMHPKNGIQQFKQDPSVECFLLHAKADSSGLNLVNATHVILCEPLINTAVELQAISRVHRIGQRRPTTVWMYIISDTVEEAVYEISVNRRLDYSGRKSTTTSAQTSRAATPAFESKLDAANSMTLQSAPLNNLLAKGVSDGEVVAKDDLWRCLFSKTRYEPSGETSQQIEEVVGRHLRAEAAEQHMIGN